MTIPRRSWRGAGALVAAAVVGLTGGVLSAGPATAHTPAWAVTCSEVSIDLTNYTSDVPNTVTVSVDGKDLLPTETFGSEFHRKLTLPEHDKPVTVRLVVKDADGDGEHSIDKTKTAAVCGESSVPTPSESTPSEPVPSETAVTEPPAPSATPSAEPSESAPAAPAPSPGSPDLAETGSSSATPVIGGAAVAVLLAGGGILWAVRKRRTDQN
ncbi:LAETG motif-containing sortase-dependent surface protein [Streptomyces sp. C11-1]|uniref:LAETG motif-containing sortase-dependent surface protein n=1 Tax=Streptomyces durocortorensis TaxID=2811104 RepID=A0ABY9W4A9_9ACTN|nr:LAETG motif-containing sortase-dependent surface protein [Streptomyces durocortorensis]WNF30984.1 LAETG motif-containing sortase-dependent surface protein [Streptomyces durocortorensis]